MKSSPKGTEDTPALAPSAEFEILDHFGQLFDVTHDLLCVMDYGGKVHFVNSSWETVLGHSRAEIKAASYLEMVHPDDRAATVADAEKVLAGIPSKAFENRVRHKNGSYRWISWSVTPSPLRRIYYAAGRDITDQKQSEERVKRLASAMENNSEMICMVDANGRAVFVNQALLQATGYQEDDLLGKSLNDTLLSPTNPPTMAGEILESLRRNGKWREECLHRRKDGTDIPVLLSISVLRDGEGQVNGAFAVVQDITARRRLEDRVVRLAHALENNQEMICLTDERGLASFVNRALLQATGFREEELLGKGFDETIFSPNNPATLQEEIQAGMAREGEWRGECLQRRKDGPDLPVSLSISMIRDNEGRITGAFAISQDITERRMLEQQLRQAQKMEAVGQLAGGVAHDFNNLLMVIMGYAGDLAERLDASDPLQKKVEQISQAGQRAASLTRQLLAFSRQQVLDPKVLDLNSVVENIQEMLRRLIDAHVELRIQFDADLGRVKADQGQMEQVIVNLAVNARDAMPHGGALTIKTANVEVDDVYVRQRPQMSPGAYVSLSVTDTGIGMDAATQSRIFEPFFTTKERGKGTGLGLATVYGIVKQSGGFVWVSSEPGEGASFEVLLPRVPELAKTTAQKIDRDGFAKGTETILLVEDDESLRSMIRDSLREFGYDVLEAANGMEAIEIARKRSSGIGLLLTDVVMPGMSGPRVAEEIVALHPAIKVVYMSGYPEFAADSEEILREGRRLLHKPYSQNQLARTVREVLETHSEPALVSQ